MWHGHDRQPGTRDQHGPGIEAIIELYRLYDALLFAANKRVTGT
jgi:hypothetical protein